MRHKYNTRLRKKSIQGLRSFKDSLPKDIRQNITKKANIFLKIISNWKKIVGKDLSDACFPNSVKNIQGTNVKRLNLMVKKGKEVDVDYSRQIIIDEINKFLGYSFIKKIKLIKYIKK
tara:strand:- start:95 stop:448 length:354 start_codon:yes stop_codon:yes gene_type:complete